jgi:dephospho-CoA kinase
MHIIGVIGGVASGKSAVSRHFAALGAGVLDADLAGHEALRLPQVEAAARQRWGNAIFGSDGKIDRARLAKIVFAPNAAGEQERKYLEQLTHPIIGDLLRRQAEHLAAEGRKAAVLDAALLIEAGWNKLCDTIVFVDVPRQMRLLRASARHWSEEEFAARERAQADLNDKRAMADAVIDNSDSPEATKVQVDAFWKNL